MKTPEQLIEEAEKQREEVLKRSAITMFLFEMDKELQACGYPITGATSNSDQYYCGYLQGYIHGIKAARAYEEVTNANDSH